MFTILRPHNRLTKPPPGVGVDPHHRLAPYTCWLLNEGAGTQLNDAALGIQSAAFVGGPTWNPEAAGGSFVTGQGYGPSLSFVAANSQYIPVTMTGKQAGFGNQPATIAALARTTSSTLNLQPYGEGDSASNNAAFTIRFNQGIAGTFGVFLFDDMNTAKTPISGPVSCNDGKWHWAIGVNEGVGGLVRVYFDGVQKGVSGVNTLSTAMKLDQARIGCRGSSTPSAFFDGDIAAVFTWNRALGAADVAGFVANPFQMFLPLRPLQPSLLPATAVIDRRTSNFRPASRIARGGL